MSYSRMSNGDELEAFNGFDELESILKEYSKKTDDSNISSVLEIGAKTLVGELLKLPKPISQIRKGGYTHLVDAFAYKKRNKQFEIGWGKYYGPMVENGSTRMRKNAHVIPTWERNKENIYKRMIERIDM